MLRVKRYTIKYPPADGGSLAYELDMVVELETVKVVDCPLTVMAITRYLTMVRRKLTAAFAQA